MLALFASEFGLRRSYRLTAPSDGLRTHNKLLGNRHTPRIFRKAAASWFFRRKKSVSTIVYAEASSYFHQERMVNDLSAGQM